jgi:hypothetical protein
MGKNQDPGSGINNPDPQHCYLVPEAVIILMQVRIMAWTPSSYEDMK